MDKHRTQFIFVAGFTLRPQSFELLFQRSSFAPSSFEFRGGDLALRVQILYKILHRVLFKVLGKVGVCKDVFRRGK
jgi:hypothetical protein